MDCVQAVHPLFVRLPLTFTCHCLSNSQYNRIMSYREHSIHSITSEYINTVHSVFLPPFTFLSVTPPLLFICFESLLIHNIKDNPQRAQAVMKKCLISSPLFFTPLDYILSSELNEPWWVLEVTSSVFKDL